MEINMRNLEAKANGLVVDCRERRLVKVETLLRKGRRGEVGRKERTGGGGAKKMMNYYETVFAGLLQQGSGSKEFDGMTGMEGGRGGRRKAGPDGA